MTEPCHCVSGKWPQPWLIAETTPRFGVFHVRCDWCDRIVSPRRANGEPVTPWALEVRAAGQPDGGPSKKASDA